MQDYCAQQTREMDYPHYVMTLFATPEKREALWALYAFNIELAKIRSLVTEKMMGMIRLQWWRDAIKGIYKDEVLRHEVVTALHTAIKTNPSWQEEDFITLIDAYETDLYQEEFSTEQEFWQHAEIMGTQLLRMACTVYGPVIAEPILKILGSAEYIANRIMHDRCCVNLNKKSIMNDVFLKINLLDRRKLKNSPAFLAYNFIKWKLKAAKKERLSNDLLLGFYLWRKSFGF